MGSKPDSLQSGLDALEQDRYLEAIDLLESYCYTCELAATCSASQKQACLLAQISLVKAYLGSGDLERALALCQAVADTDEDPLAQQWAQAALPILYTEELQQSLPDHQRIPLELPSISDIYLNGERNPDAPPSVRLLSASSR